MNLLSRIALTLVFAALAAPAPAAELTPHQAEYKVRISVISGKLRTELRATEDTFVATHIIKPSGMSRLVSRGKMHIESEFESSAEGIMPVRYHAIDTIRKEPEAQIEFDWSRNEASGTVGEDEVLFELDGLSHDAVSIQYALMHNLLNENDHPDYLLFDVEKMRVTHVREAGTKSVRTRAGEYEVVGIEHQRKGSSRITTLWCAPELDYLPVVIERHRKGKLIFKATLAKYTPT